MSRIAKPGRRSAAAEASATKVPAVTDFYGRLLAFDLNPGQAADCCATEHLLAELATLCIVRVDCAYDTNRFRDLIESQRAVPNVPLKRPRRRISCFRKILYEGRDAIEAIFCRLKDRRVATRYDRLAANFLRRIYLAAAIVWWL